MLEQPRGSFPEILGVSSVFCCFSLYFLGLLPGSRGPWQPISPQLRGWRFTPLIKGWVSKSTTKQVVSDGPPPGWNSTPLIKGVWVVRGAKNPWCFGWVFLGFCWDPFDHSEGQFSPECKKVRKKSRNGFPGPPGPGGQKSQKRGQNELKSLEKVGFELVLNSFLTFSPPKGPGNPFRDFFSDVFTFGLNCPFRMVKGIPRFFCLNNKEWKIRVESGDSTRCATWESECWKLPWQPCYLLKQGVQAFFPRRTVVVPPSLLLALAITAFGGPEGYFRLAIMAFGALEAHCPPTTLFAYHPFQNHYTHEITIFELFRGLQLQLSGSSELVSTTVTVSLLFQQNAATGNSSPQGFSGFSAITVTMI